MVATNGTPQGEAVPNKGGRPTKYLREYDATVYHLAKGGASRPEICEALNISEATFDTWKEKHRGFLEALERAREYANGQVEKSLYHRALGYSHPDVHISNFQGEITVTPITKHYAPDTNAAKFWLTNRKPREWQERTEQTNNTTVTLEAGDSIVGLVARIRGMRNVTPEQVNGHAHTNGTAELPSGDVG